MFVKRRKHQLTNQWSKEENQCVILMKTMKTMMRFNIGTGSPEPSIVVPVSINGTDILMELDTGATVSVMSEQMWKDKFSTSAPLEPSPLKLKTYTGEHLKIKGQASVEANYNGQNVTLSLQIVEGSGPALFGRNWLRTVKLDWGSIKKGNYRS